MQNEPAIAKAVALYKAGHRAEALTSLHTSAAEHADVKYLLASAQLSIAAKDFANAEIALNEAITFAPKMAELFNMLGNVVKRQSRISEAITAYERGLALNNDHILLRINYGNVLMSEQRHIDAIAQFDRAVALAPENTHALAAMAYCLQQLGRFDEALGFYRQCLAIDPTNIDALSEMLSLPIGGRDALSQGQKIATQNGIPVADRIKLHFAIGRTFDRQCEYALAFCHWQQANRLLQKTKPAFSFQQWMAQRPKVQPTLSGSITTGITPIFIVGLPRSGTTLVEQILASHSQVEGLGEIDHLPKLWRTYGPAGLQAIRDAYTGFVIERAKGKPYIVDKSLSNFDMIDVIDACFPDAKIILCRRERLDVAISCYATAFGMAQDYTTDLRNFMAVEQQFQKVARYLSNHAVTIIYEAMIGDSRKQIEGLLSTLELTIEDSCFDFHKTDRVVRTESYWQVRQPIYDSSIGRWKNYESELGSLGII
jgi:tetratricopeptide (TPR) repeat protein